MEEIIILNEQIKSLIYNDILILCMIVDYEIREHKKEKTKLYNKHYYQKHREQTLIYSKVTCICEICNTPTTNHHLKRHMKSKKCINMKLKNA